MVCLFLADGFEEIEALTPVDLLRRAEVEVQTVSVHPRRLVHGAHGIDVMADVTLEELEGVPEVAILPGGLVGVQNLGASETLCALLGTYRDAGTTLAAICAAPTLLSRLGLLAGRPFTCYPSCAAEIADGEYVDVPVCVQDGLITSAGPGTAMAFALALVSHLKGEQTAAALADGCLYQ